MGDRKNEFLLSAQIVYNVARADNNLGLKSNELREKLEQEFDDHHIFDVEKEDYSKEDLAVDKRENLNKLLEAERSLLTVPIARPQLQLWILFLMPKPVPFAVLS